MFTKDPENIGWVGNVYIKPGDKTILLVKNLKRESQITAELLKRDLQDTVHNRRIIQSRLYREGKLLKPGRYELIGGKIPWWAGNLALQKKFQALNPAVDIVFQKKTKITDIANEEQLAFLKSIGWKVLANDSLLLPAADQTAVDEFVQESGLILKKKELIFRAASKDREITEESYPRFWYRVRAATGNLRTEPDKDTISAPVWAPLMNLCNRFDKEKNEEEQQFPIHAAHIPGIYKTVEELIHEGYEDLEDILEYLYKEFPLIVGQALAEEKEKNWEDVMQNVSPLK